MIKIQRFEGVKFTSNIFVVSDCRYPNDSYLIDAGCISTAINYLENFQSLKAIFITHSHFDHIYDLSFIVTRFPKVVIYCSDYTLSGLRDSKLNLSYYRDLPIIYSGSNVKTLKDGDVVKIFDNQKVKVIETPGHDTGCLTYQINQFFFTGDALIPNIPVVTKLKSGNRQLASNSIRKLKHFMSGKDFICPGHKEICSVYRVEWNLYF